MEHGPPVSVRVVEAVANREGVDPHELTPPLHAAVDTEALDDLFRSAGRDGTASTIEFAYNGYSVRVDGTGAVQVVETDSNPEQDRSAA